jgi:hypothetical protein
VNVPLRTARTLFSQQLQGSDGLPSDVGDHALNIRWRNAVGAIVL